MNEFTSITITIPRKLYNAIINDKYNIYTGLIYESIKNGSEICENNVEKNYGNTYKFKTVYNKFKNDNLYTVKELSEIVNMKEESIRRLIRNGDIPATKHSKKEGYLIKGSDLNKLRRIKWDFDRGVWTNLYFSQK